MDHEFTGPLGARRRFDVNFGRGVLTLVAADGCEVSYVDDNAWAPMRPGEGVPSPTPYQGLMSIVATRPGRAEATLTFERQAGGDATEIRLTYLVVEIGLFIDSNRDGAVDEDRSGNGNWTWGADGRGAILVVNNDHDLSDFDPEGGHWSELAETIVEVATPEDETGLVPRLRTSPSAAYHFSVYRVGPGGPEIILGRGADRGLITTSPRLEAGRTELFVEAHEFPGPFFEGLITIEAEIADTRGAHTISVASDRAVYRVAPWVMTPNHLPPVRVYSCDMRASGAPNENFLADLRAGLSEAGVDLHVVPRELHVGDRWIQDEIEFGYSVSPTHALPVVFDSPRDRGLDGFPEAALLDADFGHFQIGGSRPNSLDSFGNLEVSPPVRVDGRDYPLGRIVFGGREQGEYADGARQMMPEIRRFLYAQKVQSPIEIYTDWLSVGHVDEIVCFVPADNAPGFQMLMASPHRAGAILRGLDAPGHGDAVLFEGMTRGGGGSAEIAVRDLLQDADFWAANSLFQAYQDQNRQILMDGLGITEADILEIPVLFYPPGNRRTLAYFPDMVNHLVLGDWSLVPKPHGPVVDGEDQFEKAFRDAMPTRQVRFVEDWYSYHELSGEVHCGTNCLRRPPQTPWWATRPDGGFDI